MARLNLICNGMMLFHEVGDGTLQIVIPSIEGHIRKYGSHPEPAQNLLTDLPVGLYALNGPTSSGAALRSLMNPDQYLMLNKKLVSVNLEAAALVSAIVTVPMPTLIRLHRASEPTGSVFGSPAMQAAAHAVPTIHHDVVVLSYLNLPAGMNIALGSLISETATTDGIFNWVLYSTEAEPLRGGAAHSTGALNNLLIFQGAPTDFALSAIGPKDSPHATGSGMSHLHMSAYHELPAEPAAPVTQALTGYDGCTGLAVSD
jgi:hypothetical protein